MLGPGSFVSASTIGTINVGLPSIQDEFGVSLSALKWVSIMGAIMMATLSLCFGRLGDIWGRRKIYKAGMIVYAIGSGLSAAALTFPNLIAVRVFMATGIAMTMPLATAIVASSVRPERRGQAIGLLAAFSSAGMLAGPSIGGFALDFFGWRGVFLANMVVAGSLAVLQHFMLRGEDPTRPAPFDFVGALLLLLGYPPLLIAMSIGPGRGWDSPLTLFWFVAAAVGLTAFTLWELRYRAPLFRFAFFRSISFSTAMFTLIVASFVQSPISLYTPIYLQDVLLMAPATVGLMMMALPLSTLFAGPVGGRLADRYEPRVIATLGMALSFVAVFGYSRLGVSTAPVLILLPLLLVGLGSGLFRPANQVAVYTGMSSSEFGSLSAMLASIGSLAGTLGATITIAISDSRGSVDDPVAFTEAQQFTFAALLPLLLVATIVSMLSRSRPRPDAGVPVPAAAAERAGQPSRP